MMPLLTDHRRTWRTVGRNDLAQSLTEEKMASRKVYERVLWSVITGLFIASCGVIVALYYVITL